MILLCSSTLFSQNKYFDEERFHASKWLNIQSLNADSTYDIKYYQLDIQIKTNPNSISVSEIITAKVLISMNSIIFDFSNNLVADSVKSGNSLLNFIHLNDKLTITLNQIYLPEQIISLLIYYHGTPVPTGYGSFIFGNNNGVSSVWTLSEPFGASDWFACKNSPDDKADSSSINITCNNNLFAVSNGKLIQVLTNSDSTRTFFWKSNYPISNYLLSLAVTNYSEYKNYFRYSPSDSMLVVHYIYPQNLNAWKTQLDKTVNMLQIFSDLFGLYPFINEKYGHAQFGKIAGMEHQTISSMGLFSDDIMSHELAHQWFGDKITCRDWHHIWLNEGFATYSEALYLEKTIGKPAYDNRITQNMSQARIAKGSIYVQNVNSITEIFDGNRSYSKGGVVLHMLRNVVGDSLFFRIIKNYSLDSMLAYKTAVTEDFQRVAEITSGQNLNYFFQEWIYGENYPKYIINWSNNLIENNTYRLTLNLSQVINTNPLYFTMPCELKVNTGIGDTLLKFFNDSQQQSFNFTITGKPVSVTFDPDNKILKDKTGDEPAVLVKYYLNQNYPNPFNPETTIEYEIMNYVDVSLTVYDILGRIVKVPVNEKQKPGSYTVKFNTDNLSSGVYIYKIIAGEFTDSKKMLKIK